MDNLFFLIFCVPTLILTVFAVINFRKKNYKKASQLLSWLVIVLITMVLMLLLRLAGLEIHKAYGKAIFSAGLIIIAGFAFKGIIAKKSQESIANLFTAGLVFVATLILLTFGCLIAIVNSFF